MDVAVDILAFRIVFSLIIFIHLDIAVNNAQFSCTSNMILPRAPLTVTAEQATCLPTVSASWTSFLTSIALLELASHYLLLWVDEPYIDEPINTADVSPNFRATVLDGFERPLHTGAEIASNFVNLRAHILQ